MTFINEKIPVQDWEKYEFSSPKMRRNGSGTPQRDWAINGNRDIWIRVFNETQDRDNYGEWDQKTVWDYYWKGLLLSVTTLLIESVFTDDHSFYYFKLLEINIPADYQSQTSMILQDLHEALSVYGLYGIYEDDDTITIQLDCDDIENTRGVMP